MALITFASAFNTFKVYRKISVSFWLFQNLDCFKIWTVSKFELFQNLNCFKIWTVSKFGLFQNLNCLKIWTVSKFELLQNLNCFKIWTVSKLELFQNLNCLKTWTVSKFGLFKNLNCFKTWTVSKFGLGNGESWNIQYRSYLTSASAERVLLSFKNNLPEKSKQFFGQSFKDFYIRNLWSGLVSLRPVFNISHTWAPQHLAWCHSP